ncbi:MAG: hypothetical protein EU544_06375 [Promethearchaeota archaeon]|nr:MAG: hypothetical protein EU544_06375 [Candidatus Lokiarchaeota archaeon]
MNAKERILAVYNDEERKNLDRVPTHVQYVDPPFISKYIEYLEDKYDKDVFNQYFGAPYALGFDSIFAPFPSSIKFRSIKVLDKQGNSVRIGLNGQKIKQKTPYYEGGYVYSLETVHRMKESLQIINKRNQISAYLKKYEKIEDKIYPIVMVDGIFDKAWQAMGMVEFSKNFSKKTRLYKELIQFYAHITETEIKALIDASDKKKRVINILDDVAYRGRTMISPKRWDEDFLPLYKKITKLITEAGMVPQIHTDGDPTDMIPYFQKAGFYGLQGWEGGADPFLINQNFPSFVILGFGDVSHILPYGTASEIKLHVQSLMNALKDNRHFIIGPSTIIQETISLKNIKIFMAAVKKYGKYT